MEHKLISGGEQWLPFARSRIKALRATGLKYVTQKYIIDGANIEVRLVGEIEYIRIDGGSTTLYMESGQLEWSFPSDLNPDRYKPAVWHFLDIPTTNKFLGYAEMGSDTGAKPVGTQKNKPLLYEGMKSKAIGPPWKDPALAVLPDTAAAIQAINDAKESEFGEFTKLKKLTVGIFPATLFSGKMRLFMQSQWGAMQNAKGDWPWTLEIFVESVLLKYSITVNEVSGLLQMGFWSHLHQGIFVQPDGENSDYSFWMIQIRQATSDWSATAYPIIIEGVGEAYSIYKKKRKDASFKSPLERTQIEAYLFAYATIDITKPQVIGSFAAGATGGSLNYGWHWNRDGSKASIVLSETLGTDNHDNRWSAKTIHASFTREIDPVTKVGTFHVTAEVSAAKEWQDGWGAYNIFTPLDETGTQLGHYSIMTDRFAAHPIFAFTDVEVYGFYKPNDPAKPDEADSWQSVKMTRNIETGTWPKYIQKSTGIAWALPAYEANTNNYQYGYALAGASITWEAHTLSESDTMTLKVGNQVYAGVSTYGLHEYLDASTAGGTTVQNPVSYTAASLSGVFPPAFNPPGADDGYETPSWVPTHNFVTTGVHTQHYWTFTGWDYSVWTLVIPAYDCDAVFVGTKEYVSSNVYNSTIKTHPSSMISFSGSGTPGYNFRPWAMTGEPSDWIGIGGVQSSVAANDPPPRPAAEIYCHTQAVTAQGSYHASATPLFLVDKDFAFYNAGMSACTSYGGRYIISEGLVSPPSITGTWPFVGWA